MGRAETAADLAGVSAGTLLRTHTRCVMEKRPPRHARFRFGADECLVIWFTSYVRRFPKELGIIREATENVCPKNYALARQ